MKVITIGKRLVQESAFGHSRQIASPHHHGRSWGRPDIKWPAGLVTFVANNR